MHYNGMICWYTYKCSIDSLHQFLFILLGAIAKSICNFREITKFVSSHFVPQKTTFMFLKRFACLPLAAKLRYGLCRIFHVVFFQKWLPIPVNWTSACPVDAVVLPCLTSACTLWQSKMLPTRMLPKPCPPKRCPREWLAPPPPHPVILAKFVSLCFRLP